MIKKKIKSLCEGDLGRVIKGMLTLLVGAGLARVIGLLSIPILTRLYTPAEFGVLSLYTAFVAVLAPTLTLRYVLAIPLPKADALAANLFILCLKLIIVGGLSLVLFFLAGGEVIFKWLNMQELNQWWWLIVVGAVGTSLYELFGFWATRKRCYRVLSKSQFYQSLIGNFTKIGLGFLSYTGVGLLFGQFVSQSAGISTLARVIFKEFNDKRYRISLNNEWLVAKRYKGFVWFRMPSHVLMVLSLQAPLIIVSALYDGSIVGQLGLAMMALSLPVNLIGLAVARAYYAEVAAIGSNGAVRIKKITFELQRKLAVVAMPIAVITFFCAESIFVVLFGSAWEQAGQFVAVLAPYVFLRFTSTPLEQILNVLGSQKQFLVINFLRVMGYVILYVMAEAFAIGVNEVVMLMSLYLCAYYLSMSAFILYIVHRKAKEQIVFPT